MILMSLYADAIQSTGEQVSPYSPDVIDGRRHPLPA